MREKERLKAEEKALEKEMKERIAERDRMIKKIANDISSFIKRRNYAEAKFRT